VVQISKVGRAFWDRQVRTAFVAGAALLVAGSAADADPSASAKACAAEIREYCGSIPPGGGEIEDCVKSHFSDFSADCQVAIVRTAAVGRACEADVNRLCADVKPGKGAIADCMKEHTADVSDGCKEAIAKAQEGESSASTDTVPPRDPQRSVAVALQVEGGTFVVPVLINGAIKLKFKIDSGSAEVSVPADVVMTLMRAGTISGADFQGNTTYTLADGSTLPSPNFNIRSLKVGNKILKNVKGSVAPVKGGLLLGRSFLNRFKSWSIDSRRQVLLLN
jgi:predicted aspartyl protease